MHHFSHKNSEQPVAFNFLLCYTKEAKESGAVHLKRQGRFSNIYVGGYA